MIVAAAKRWSGRKRPPLRGRGAGANQACVTRGQLRDPVRATGGKPEGGTPAIAGSIYRRLPVGIMNDSDIHYQPRGAFLGGVKRKSVSASAVLKRWPD